MDIRYLAGFFDGEGTIGLYHHKGSPNDRYRSGRATPSWIRMVGVTNTYVPILRIFRKRFGGRIGVVKQHSGMRKTCYLWMISARADIAACLKTLWPYLKEKHPQARTMLRALSNQISHKEAAGCLKQLKRIG